MFAGYRIGRVLGQGAMGQVYEAQDPSLGRRVAIKLLGKAGEGSADRFQREGELAARLEHPGIVRVHAAGVEGGRSYIVYELVSGARALDEAWAEVGLQQRVSWIRDVARALGYAHGLGVVHRDVKPENLLVDEMGAVRITDFGVAGATDLERLTKTGALIGTPTHMAPEQMTGESRPGPATDVWALGVVLYQALCDELPFEGHDWLTLATQVAGGQFRPPSDSGAEVPVHLERICQQALRTDPSERPPSGDALADLLDDWLEGRAPVLSRGRGGRLGLGLALLGGLLVVGLAVALPRVGAPSALRPSPTRTPSPTPPANPSPSPSQLTLSGVSRRLRKAAPGPERLAAYLAARDWLASCEDPRERRLLVQRLAIAAREPLAQLSIARPGEAEIAGVRAHAWGDRIFVTSKGQALLLDPSRAEVAGPWAEAGLIFAEVNPRRGLLGKGEVVRAGEGFHFSPSRSDFKAPPVGLAGQAIGRTGRYLACGAQSLAWGSKDSLRGTFRIRGQGRYLSFSPSGERVAIGCSLSPEAGGGDRYTAWIQVFDLGEHPVLVFEQELVSRVRALAWSDEKTLAIGQLVGNVMFLDVPGKKLRVEVGPPSGTAGILPLGGVNQLLVRRDLGLAVCRDGLLGWKPGAGDRASEEVTRVPWAEPTLRVYASAELDGVLWVFTKAGEVSAYSARVADYALESQR